MGMKIAQQPLMMKPGISKSPTDFEGFSLLMALQTSTSETGAMDRNSEHCEKRGKSIEEQLLCIDWKCLAKASATAVGSAKCVPSTFSWIEPDLCFLKLDTYFQKCWGCDCKLLSMDFNHLSLLDLINNNNKSKAIPVRGLNHYEWHKYFI
jgi:hypothetical protein